MTDELPYDCPECPRAFETESGLHVHCGHQHGGVPPELRESEP